MSSKTKDFLHIMKARGFVHQCSSEDGLSALLNKQMVTAYIGFDCTAPSLHVGSMLPIMMLSWFQKCGHRPIVLMGGGTTRVGDPSGKDKSRQLLTEDKIEANKQGIKQVFSKFLTFGDKDNQALMVDNADWLLELNYVDFLRDIGRHFSLNRMLTFESVKQRLEREHPLSFLEFNYMILQAYDFLELNKRYDCLLQMGGSDQWGNIVNGIDLTRRVNETEVFALTAPLLTTASGAKMGKTADGAVWLDEAMLSPYDYWQYWRNTEDADVGRFLRLFTELPFDEIEKLEALEGAEINEAKKILAGEATSLIHGKEKADAAAATAQKTFEQGTLGDDLPRVKIDLSAPVEILNALVTAGLAKSNGEARRHIQGGGVKVNDEKVSDFKAQINQSMAKDGVIKLSFGKKKHVLIETS